MIREVYIGGSRHLLSSLVEIGKGGEAVIYRLPSGNVLKVFKTSDHPDFENNTKEQEGAVRRIAEHQRKLAKFPRGLPSNVIAPLNLATDRSGNAIVGYEMPFVDTAEWIRTLSDPAQHNAGLSNASVTRTFILTHHTVDAIHKKGVVIADFNDVNVLLKGESPIFIDADSAQFAGFLTQTFTAAFVDPLLCNVFNGKLNLAKPHNESSDWYAFAAILLNSYLCCGGPYGGVYVPKDPKQRMPHDLRPLKRISVFHQEVKYPRPAMPIQTLTDELLHRFAMIFEKDERGIFPLRLIENLEWQRCIKCGVEHSRRSCPTCVPQPLGQVVQTTIVKGKVTADDMFKRKGAVIVSAVLQGGKMQYVYHENGGYHREDGKPLFASALDPEYKFWISGKSTLVSRGREFVCMEDGENKFRSGVDVKGKTAFLGANSTNYFWAFGGALLRNAQFGQEDVGKVLNNRTQFWVGERFGFGFYQVGAMTVGFTFDSKGRGLNDSVSLPRIRGDVIEASCYFSGSRCWFFWSTRESGKNFTHCAVIEQKGLVIASDSAEENDPDKMWFKTVRGKCAVGEKLLSATDDGIVSLSVSSGTIVLGAKFEDTEQFVNSESMLLPGPDGLYVVGPKSIMRLKIS